MANGVDVSALPVAYLAGANEVNSDKTNYWIFSQAGLIRLCERAGWRVVNCVTAGDTSGSNPVDGDHDERAFCLLESVRYIGPMSMETGFYEQEPGGWRWTMQRFSFMVDHVTHLQLEAHIIPEALEPTGTLGLRIHIGETLVHQQQFSIAGPVQIRCQIPAEHVANRIKLEFRLERPTRVDTGDTRELGIIVSSAHFESGALGSSGAEAEVSG